MHRKLLGILFGAVASVAMPLLFANDSIGRTQASLLSLAVYLAACELLFRGYYRWRTGRHFARQPRIPFDKMYIQPHPYLPFAYKRNALGQPRSPTTYPLHVGRFMFPEVRLNSYGICDGPYGARNPVTPKPDGTLRVLCLGASTTGNCLEEDGQFHSYPDHLERILAERFPGKTIEVVNGGVGGRTSAEILVDYALNLIDLQPDIVVLYHAYNDLGPSLTPNFASDYAHARRSLGETYHLFRWGAKLPNLPSALYTYTVEALLGGNIRHNLISAISRAEPDLTLPFQGTTTYRRNVEHILAISRARGIPVVLSSFCHFFYPGTEESAVHKRYAEGLALENAVTRELAEAHKLPYADAASLLPQDLQNYVDFIHFTPSGMRSLAGIIADKVTPLIQNQGLA